MGTGEVDDEEIKESNQLPYSEKGYAYQTPTPVSKIPFMPKFCEIKEKLKIFWVGADELIIDSVTQTHQVPMSDNYYIGIRIVLTLVSANCVRYFHKVRVHFVKSTMFAKTIEKAIVEQFRKTTDSLLPVYQQML